MESFKMPQIGNERKKIQKKKKNRIQINVHSSTVAKN